MKYAENLGLKKERSLMTLIKGAIPLVIGIALAMSITLMVFFASGLQLLFASIVVTLILLILVKEVINSNEISDDVLSQNDIILARDKNISKMYNEIMLWITGYPEPIQIGYADLIGSGVCPSTIHIIDKIKREVSPEDTLFLIRLNHKRGIMSIHVSGKSINVELANWALKKSKDKITQIASENFIIYKDDSFFN